MKAKITTVALVSLLAINACEQQENTARAPLTNDQAVAHAKEAAQQSFFRLSAELKTAIETGGAASAIKVCSQRAPAILGEVSDETGFDITRLSDKARNPNHTASGDDLDTIVYFRKSLSGGSPIEPQVASHPDGSKTVRLPIMISLPLCLQCHGSETEIALETRAAIASTYPDDQATGYQIGDLRGIWRIDVPAEK